MEFKRDIIIIPGPRWLPVMLLRLLYGVLLLYSCVTFGRSQEERGRHVTGMGYMYKYHFNSIAEGVGFYIDVGRVVDFITELSNAHRV